MASRFFCPSPRSLSLRLVLLVAATFQSATALASDVATSSDSDGATQTAGSGTEAESSRPSPAPKTEPDASHRGQVSLRLAMVGGFHIVMRYDESPWCAEPEPGKEPKKFCGFGAPLGLDTALGYAPIPGVEPFLWGRFGLAKESDTYTKPLLVLGAGVRLYTMSDAPLKVFIEPAVGAEFESGTSDAPTASDTYKQDWLVRLAVGPQYDIGRYFGIYGAGAMSLGFVRSLNASMEAHLGVQGRFR